MKLLKKKYGKQRRRIGEAKQKAAGRVALWLLKLQRAFAKFMDRRFNPLSAKKKRWLFYGFCCLLSMYCLYLVVYPFAAQRKKDTIKVSAIQFTKPKQKQRDPDNDRFLSVEEYNRIHAFKLYLDSLASDAKGKAIFDSITAMHPGLMDSLKLVEEYYQLQK